MSWRACLLLTSLWLSAHLCRGLPLPGADSTAASNGQQQLLQQSRDRGGKSLFGQPLVLDPTGFLDYDQALAAALASAAYAEPVDTEDNEILSRTRPGTKKPTGNSPIYYIRLPPSPYVFLPGVGYVSDPPRPRPPPVVQTRPDSPLIPLPVHFVSNGKPTSVYVLDNQLQLEDSPIVTLDKGPYVFNGRPTEVSLLRDAYNSLYADALDNFYP